LLLQLVVLKAQQIDSDLINESTFIVEGEILRQEYRYKPDKPEDIQTLSFIEVSDVLKGQIGNEQIAIITEGGMLDGMIQTYSHYPKLTTGEKGIFFLVKIRQENNVILTKMTGEKKGLLSYTRNE